LGISITEVAVSNGDDIEVKGAPNSWLAFASKYGLPGIVIGLMAAFIWIMFNFIAGGMTNKLTSIETEVKAQVTLQREQMVIDKDQAKDNSNKMDALIKAVERIRR
jgi:hypothetical protein